MEPQKPSKETSFDFKSILRGVLRRVNPAAETPLVKSAMETLQKTMTFGSLPTKHIRQLARMMHFRDYRNGEYVYHEQDPGLGLYVVQTGQVRLITEDVEGKVHVLKEVGQTGVIGAASLCGEFRRRATAQAVGSVRLLGFFRPDYKTLVRRHPQAGAAIAMALSRNLAFGQIRLIRHLVEKNGKLAAMKEAYHVIEGTAVIENEEELNR